jgi:DNA polymerase III subunit delta'
MIGFESTKSALLKSYQSQKLHHAILLQGKKGIGKASFAQEFVNEILHNNSAPNPDLFIVKKDEEKREIGVDKIRAISNFANQTSAISNDKFIIIDSACELNKSASNALLKLLEEPRPNNFLILVSHNLNQVLPTIRSRCQIVKIPDLSYENFCQILQQNNLYFPPSDLEFLAEICNNSPAEVINFGKDLTKLYPLFLRSILNKRINGDLLKDISAKNFSFTIFEKICEFFFCRLQKLTQQHLPKFYFEEEKLFTELLAKIPTKKLFAISDESLYLLRKTSNLNLDKKLTLLNIFNLINH